MRTSFLSIWIGSGCAFITEDEYAHRMSATPAPDCAFTTLYYADTDEDGYGNPDVVLEDCTAPEGTVDNPDDCDDSDAEAFPGALRAVDQDGDGYGSMEETVESCLIEDGMSATADDCDDTDPAVNPGMVEDCSTVKDDDCDGDDNDADATGCTDWYADGDNDGFAGGDAVCLCEATATYFSTAWDDCDDSDLAIHPEAEEVCGDGIDNNCDESALGCGFLDESAASYAAYTIAGVIDAVPGVSEAGSAGADLLYAPDLDGDGQDDLLIGAYGGSALTLVSGLEPGAYTTDDFVYLRAETEAEAEAGQRLTRDVVVPGDLDGDGLPDLMLGAPNATVEGRPAAGRANIYFGPIGETTDLTAPDVQVFGPLGNANFGRDLGVVGDFNGDEIADVFAGGLNIKDPFGVKAGAAYLILGPLESGEIIDGAVSDEIDVAIYGDTLFDKFGVSLVAMEDWTGDGLPDLLVGARTATGGTGAVYGFESGLSIDAGGVVLWAAEADVTISGLGSGAQTGEAMTMLDDVTGDGLADLLVGAPGRNLEGVGRGAAYLLSALATGGIGEIAQAEFRGPEDNARFGAALAGMGALDAEGTQGIAIGAPAHAATGAVHVYGGPFEGSITADMAIGMVTGVAEGDGFGSALIGGVDYDGDGMFDLTVGSPTANAGRGEVRILLGGAL